MKNLTALSLSVMILIATGCSKSVTSDGTSGSSGLTSTTGSSSTSVGGSSSGTGTGTSTTNTSVVCNPMSSDAEVVGPWNGLKGTLSYDLNSDAGDANDYSLASLSARATVSNTPVYMSEINVPTRYWTDGFTTTSGSTLDGPNGLPILQWFKLSFDSKLRLASYDEPGLRQFAVIADDGAIFSLDPGTGLSPLVNGDGLQSSRFSCASSAVWMGHQKDYPMHLDYYQGPASELAVMILWRKIPDVYGTGEQDSPILDPASLNDSMCGAAGNDVFFNHAAGVPSTPTQAFEQMRARGWEVVPAINFIMPGKEPNPCANGVYSSGAASAPSGN